MSVFASSMKVFNAIFSFLTKKPVLQQALLFNASAATKLQYELGRRRFHCFLSTSITSSIAHSCIDDVGTSQRYCWIACSLSESPDKSADNSSCAHLLVPVF